MCVVHTLLVIVTLLSLISRILSLMQTTKEVDPHPCMRYVIVYGVSPFASSSSSSFDATCWMLVHAYATSPGKAKWSGPHQRRWEKKHVLFPIYMIAFLNGAISMEIYIHPKLYNITRSLISGNPRERMCVVHISLLTVTLLSLISRIFIDANHRRSRPTPSHYTMCQYVEYHLLLLLLLLFWCHLLNVGACICHIAREGHMEWTTLTEMRGEWLQIP